MNHVYVATEHVMHMLVALDGAIDKDTICSYSSIKGVYATREQAIESLYEVRKYHRNMPGYEKECVEEVFNVDDINVCFYNITTEDSCCRDTHEYSIEREDIIKAILELTRALFFFTNSAGSIMKNLIKIKEELKMCSICEELYNNESTYSACRLRRHKLSVDTQGPISGLNFAMCRSSRHVKIVRGEWISDKTIETPVTYLKTAAWNRDGHYVQSHVTFTEVLYCPFCGEKLH